MIKWLNMKYVYYILLGCLCASLLSGCSEKEDVQPLNLKDNYYEVPEDANDPESVLRREFKESMGIHLLFNDTLRNEYRGTDRYGNEIYFVQKVDFSYYLTSMAKQRYLFDYLKDIESQRAAVDFMKTRILSVFSPKLYPYSLLLVKRIDAYQSSLDGDQYELVDEDMDYIAGWNSMAVAFRDVLNMNEEEKRDYAAVVLRQIVSNGISNVEESEFEEFFSYAASYYEKLSLFAQLSDIRSVGFLGSNPIIGLLVKYYSKAEDQASYVNALLTMTEEEFMAENGNYPACVAKWNEMKRVLIDLGLKFD